MLLLLLFPFTFHVCFPPAPNIAFSLPSNSYSSYALYLFVVFNGLFSFTFSFSFVFILLVLGAKQEEVEMPLCLL